MKRSNISKDFWILLLTIGLLVYILNIDYTAVNMALRPVSQEITADLSDLQWLLSAYVLVWAALMIPASRLGDLMGKKRTITLGLCFFMVGSLVTGVGHSLSPLIAGRILQGVGAAFFISPIWSLISSTAPPGKQGFAVGFVVSFAGLGMATGPTIGGYLIDYLSWRWIFYINIPLGLVALGTLLRFAPKDMPLIKHIPFNVLSALCLTTCMGLFFYTLNLIEETNITWHTLAILFSLSAAFGMLYVIKEKKSATPLIPHHLFRNKNFMYATMGSFLISITYALTLVLVALYLQNTLGYTSKDAGLIFATMTLALGALSPVGGRLTDRFGARNPMLWGCLLTTLGFVAMAHFGHDSSLIFVCASLFVTGTGLGLYLSSSNTAMLQSVPAQDISVASGIFAMFKLCANSLSVIMATSLVVMWGRSFLMNSLEKAHLVLTTAQHQTLVNLIAQVEPQSHPFTGFSPQDVPLLLNHITHAFLHGFGQVMMMGCACALGAFLCTTRLKVNGKTEQHHAMASTA